MTTFALEAAKVVVPLSGAAINALFTTPPSYELGGALETGLRSRKGFPGDYVTTNARLRTYSARNALLIDLDSNVSTWGNFPAKECNRVPHAYRYRGLILEDR